MWPAVFFSFTTMRLKCLFECSKKVLRTVGSSYMKRVRSFLLCPNFSPWPLSSCFNELIWYSLHVLIFFFFNFSEMTFYLNLNLKGFFSECLYRLFFCESAHQVCFFPALDWHETRLSVMGKCFFPLIFAGILHIMGTILRWSSFQNHKRKLLSPVKLYKSSTFGHMKSIFVELQNSHSYLTWSQIIWQNENCKRTTIAKVH